MRLLHFGRAVRALNLSQLVSRTSMYLFCEGEAKALGRWETRRGVIKQLRQAFKRGRILWDRSHSDDLSAPVLWSREGYQRHKKGAAQVAGKKLGSEVSRPFLLSAFQSVRRRDWFLERQNSHPQTQAAISQACLTVERREDGRTLLGLIPRSLPVQMPDLAAGGHARL